MLLPTFVALLLVAYNSRPEASAASLASASSVYVEKSAYKNVVIEIRDNVPVENCQTILHNVEVCTSSFITHRYRMAMSELC